MPKSLFASIAALAMVATACATAPPVPEGADPILDRGRTVWANSCASCHGVAGGGAKGPKLNEGAVLVSYPLVEDQIELVTTGRNAMPGFAGRLSEADIEAVVRYTQEVLAVTE